MGISSMTSSMESSPEQEQIGLAMTGERSQQLAEAGPNQGTEHQIAGLILTGTHSRDQAYPAAHLTVAENGESVAHRMNFIPESEPGRVHVAQQPVADGSFGLDQFFDARARPVPLGKRPAAFACS